MSKLSSLLPAAALTIAAAQIGDATAQPAQSATPTAPLLMQFTQPADYAEPTQLSSFAFGIMEKITPEMRPVDCDDDYECWKRVCGTGSFCGRVQVDDTDQAC